MNYNWDALEREIRKPKNEAPMFHNVFPQTISLKIVDAATLKLKLTANIPAGKAGVLNGVYPNDQILLYNSAGKLLIDPYVIPNNFSHFQFGGISYNDNSTNSLYDINSDITNVWVTNHLSIPMDFYYNNKLSLLLSGKNVVHQDEDPYVSGAGSEAYFDNYGYGLNIGQRLAFGVNPSKVPYIFGVLPNKWVRRIDIGLIQPIG